MNILEHPELKDLKPENKRESLIYFKAYIEAIEASMAAMEKFGFTAVQKIHEQMKADLMRRIGAIK